MKEPLIYDLSSPGREGVSLPAPDVPLADLPTDLLRDNLDLPEVSEVDVVRHYLRLSHFNHSIDQNMYPLGSCTMKYNPKLNEDTARLPGFAGLHPYQPAYTVQGALELMYELQEWLKELGGFAGVSLQPAAGAHGEFTGILIMRAYHLDRGDTRRVKVLIPDSAHGTNPASTTMSGLEVVELPSDERGNIDLEALRAACDDTVVGLMITNPNTLGLFEENIREVIKLVHDHGGLVYGDGANFNALMGIVRPGDLGFDVLHYNLHKTFGTPHGGGGPGSGPVGVSERLLPFLPGPIVDIIGESDEGEEDKLPVFGFVTPEKSIGRMKAFYGQFAVLVRAYTYMLVNGGPGLRRVSEMAVLNANYLMKRVGEAWEVPYGYRTCMHEFVAEGDLLDINILALDVSKRLMDYGFHPPTNYFPLGKSHGTTLQVHGALMIEPTETESKETLDAFADAMLTIAKEAREQPELLHEAPHITPVGRLDEVRAAKELVLCCRPLLRSEST
jgi:glycine dehydrogenase subunit 2